MLIPTGRYPNTFTGDLKHEIKSALIELRKIFVFHPLQSVFLNAYDATSALEHLVPEPRPGSPGADKIGAIFVLKDDYDAYYRSAHRASKSTFFHIPGYDMLYRVFPYQHEHVFPDEPAAFMVGQKIGTATGRNARYSYTNLFEFCYNYAKLRNKETVEAGYRFGHPFIILYRENVVYRGISEYGVLTVPRSGLSSHWEKYVEMRRLYDRYASQSLI
jgi:hypothetical protein